MKRLLFLFLLMSTVAYAVPEPSYTPRVGAGYKSAQEDYQGTAAAPAITFFGDTDTGVYRKAANSVGISTGGTERVYVDSTGLNGDVVANDLIVDLFAEFDPGAAIDTSATTNASITPLTTYVLVDTHNDQAVSTVNNIVTANIANGTVLIIQSNVASQDVVFIETGNLDLGGTRTLSDPRDKLMLIKSGDDQFDELSFVDNN